MICRQAIDAAIDSNEYSCVPMVLLLLLDDLKYRLEMKRCCSTFLSKFRDAADESRKTCPSPSYEKLDAESIQMSGSFRFFSWFFFLDVSR